MPICPGVGGWCCSLWQQRATRGQLTHVFVSPEACNRAAACAIARARRQRQTLYNTLVGHRVVRFALASGWVSLPGGPPIGCSSLCATDARYPTVVRWPPCGDGQDRRAFFLVGPESAQSGPQNAMSRSPFPLCQRKRLPRGPFFPHCAGVWSSGGRDPWDGRQAVWQEHCGGQGLLVTTLVTAVFCGTVVIAVC